MKRKLHCTVLVCALLAFGLNMQGQAPGDPMFKVPAMTQAVINKSAGKLSPDLQRLLNKQASTRQSSAARVTPLPGDEFEKLLQLRGSNVVVDITIAGDSKRVRADLKKIGFIEKGAYGRVISGLMPITSLPALDMANGIRYAKPAYKPMHGSHLLNANSTSRVLANPVTPVISQGDSAQRSYLARKLYNVNGKGVKIGILSDSYNNLAGADSGVLRGELPGPGNPFNFDKPVQVLEDLEDSSGTDEGRGMAEIVHDVAPGAELLFHTAFNGEADFAQGIIDLAEAGCKVINDDVFYYDEPFFQDGIIAQAVDYVKKKGVTYFSSAGNFANYSYESDYRRSVDTPVGAVNGTAHNFSAPGAPARYFQPIRIPRNQSTIVNFQWDESFYSAGGAGAESDLDIYLLNSRYQVVAGSAADNIANGDPFEIFGYTNRTVSDTFYIMILHYAGQDPHHLKYILYNETDFPPFFSTNPSIPGNYAPTLVGHAKAEGAIATAAAPYLYTPAYGVDTPRIEVYSALGGVPNYLDAQGNRINPVVRKKPEITTPDGGNTSFFGQEIRQDSDTYPNFFGTSAAAPHAAGVAALMIQAQKLQTITPDQIKGVMASRTVDMDNPYTPGFDKGFDFRTGTGLVKADEAVNVVRFPNLYVKDLKLQTLCSNNPSTTRNWKITNPNPFEVAVHWFITGSQQTGTVTVPPGEYTFSTNTLYLFNFNTPNIAVIDWQDNFGFPHFDATTSSTAKCSKDIVANSNADKMAENSILAETIEKPNLAEVYPNPSRTSFRVYLSLAQQQNINLELYTIDGKRLYQKTRPSSGIEDINASGYKPGLYILKITQGTFTKTLKLIKQ